MAAPVSPSAGTLVDDSFWNAEIYAKWVALYAGWTAYTPTWSCVTTPPAIGNGSLVGAYKAIGKLVEFRLRWVAGSTTTYGDGLWSFSLPPGFAPAITQAAAGIAVNGSSSTRYVLGCWLSPANGIWRIAADGSSGVKTVAAIPANSVPFQWSTGAHVTIGGVYESS